MGRRAWGWLALSWCIAGCSGEDESTASEPDASRDATAPPNDARAPVADGAGTSEGDASVPPTDASVTPPDAADLDASVPAYAVGVTTRTWVDPSRPTPASGSEAAKPSRTLVTEVWYPAAGSSATTPVRDAPLATGGPYPLVLYVHGSSSGRTFSSFLTIGLARAGYVVAAADFPLTALGTAGGSSDLHVTDQVGDLSFLADRLKAVSLDSTDALKGAVDGAHYAVVGHSTGGAVAALAAFGGDDGAIKHDPRVSAAIPLSGDACMFDASFFKKRSVPIFAIGATNDLFVRLPNSGKWVFDQSNPPHLLAKLVGGQHMGFTDVNLPDFILNPVPTGPASPLATTLSTYGDAGACLPIPAAGTDPPMAFDAQHAIVIRLVTAYLEAQMRHRAGPLAAVLSANDAMVAFEP
jgi:alpha-beta hydrolase superfamily lysophospholipase